MFVAARSGESCHANAAAKTSSGSAIQRRPWCSGARATLQQQRERADEADREEEDVEPGRPAVEEHVPERAECDGDTEQCDPEAAFPTHPVGNADSRL